MDDVDIAGLAAMLARADPGPLERGEWLADDDAVSISSIERNVVTARVQGTERYLVRVDAGASTWSCSCPYAADGSFCKHAVAVICVVISPDDPEPVDAPVSADAPSDLERLVTHVAGLTHDELVEIVVDQAKHDPALADRLLIAAVAAAGEPLDLADWKKRMTAVFRGGGGFIEWRHAAGWASEIHEFLDAVRALLGAGYATEVAALAEHAHLRAQSAMQRVDDSGGEITGIVEVAAELHREAAELGAYEPKALAKRLAKLELSAELDTFHRSAITYADLLGGEGLAVYGKAVDAAWAKLSPDAPRWGPAFRVRHARAGHAIATGDPDRFVEVFKGDTMLPGDYVDLVELFIAADRLDEAADWADRGLEERAGHRQLDGLRSVRAKLLRLAGDPAEVEALYWNALVRRPTAAAVHDLLDNAVDRNAAATRVLDWVNESLDDLRSLPAAVDPPTMRPRGTSPAQIGEVGAAPAHRPGARFGSDMAIDVFVALAETDHAWAVAMEFGASRHNWDRLITKTGGSRPDDGVRWGLVVAAMEIDGRDRKHYRRAVRALRDTERRFCASTEGTARTIFDAGVQQILADHANKPSLLDEFGKAGWTR